MRKNKQKIVFLSIITFFIFGTYWLFSLQFEAGDIYPPYSSLRSDPLGTRAFFESCDNLNQISTERNFLPFKRIKWEKADTFFFAGSKRLPVKSRMEAFNKQAKKGKRIVYMLFPVDRMARLKKGKSIGSWETKGFTVKKFDWKSKDKSIADYRFDNRLSLHSNRYFQIKDNSWKTILSYHNYPVIIEKKIGNGSIVMTTDSYYISNEILKKNPTPKLLLWLIGGKTRIVFDEAHFNIKANYGIASLIKEYDLVFFFITIIIVTILFIWKNATHFIPPLSTGTYDDENILMEKDSRAGLINLLYRNINKKDLLKKCMEEYKRTLNKRTNTKDTITKAENVVENIEPKEIISGYNEISKILSKKEPSNN